MQLVRLIELKKGYMQPIVEIETTYSNLMKMQNLLLQMHRLQMQMQDQLQMSMRMRMSMSIQMIAADRIDSAKKWS